MSMLFEDVSVSKEPTVLAGLHRKVKKFISEWKSTNVRPGKVGAPQRIQGGSTNEQHPDRLSSRS